MRAFLLSILLCVSTAAHSVYDVALSQPYHWPVVRIIDGDTAVVDAPWLPPELGKEIAIRLVGVDAPEISWRAQCDAEKAKGRESLSALSKLIARPGVTVRVVGWDKYGGRVLGDFVTSDGRSVSQIMLDQGLLKVYTGVGPKPNWCD